MERKFLYARLSVRELRFTILLLEQVILASHSDGNILHVISIKVSGCFKNEEFRGGSVCVALGLGEGSVLFGNVAWLEHRYWNQLCASKKTCFFFVECFFLVLDGGLKCV